MEVRYQVHDAYQDAQAYRHRETDDGEADAEHDAHAESNHSLSTDVIVEFPFHVLHQLLPERAALLREDANPVGGQRLVIEQDEEHI